MLASLARLESGQLLLWLNIIVVHRICLSLGYEDGEKEKESWLVSLGKRSTCALAKLASSQQRKLVPRLSNTHHDQMYATIDQLNDR